MRRRPNPRALVCVVATWALAAPTSADTPTDSVVTLAPEDLPEPDGDARITEVRALAIALEANSTFRAALFDRISARAGADAASASRMPTFVTTTSGAYRESLVATPTGGSRTRDRNISNSMGLRYTTNVGTVLSLDIVNTTLWREINRDNSTGALVLIGPSHTATATVSARQPLLRGSGRDVVLSTQHQADAVEDQAENDTETAASRLVVDVLSAYWELWYAERAVAVQTDALNVATRQRDEAEQRVRLGTAARADVLQLATNEASLREAVLTSQTTRASRALELARLLGLGAATLDVVETHPDEPQPGTVPDLAAAVETMRERSPALRALDAQVDAARARQLAASNVARPRLDVTGTLGAAGLWAPNDPLTGLQLPGGRPALVGSVGLELELPLVSDVRAAQRAAAQADLDAAEARRAAEVERLHASLATEHATLSASVGRIDFARGTAAVAEQLAEAERARLALGTSTASVLVTAQQTARESRLRVARTLVDSALSSARFAHDTGTLLNRFGLVVPEDVSR